MRYHSFREGSNKSMILTLIGLGVLIVLSGLESKRNQKRYRKTMTSLDEINAAIADLTANVTKALADVTTKLEAIDTVDLSAEIASLKGLSTTVKAFDDGLNAAPATTSESAPAATDGSTGSGSENPS